MQPYIQIIKAYTRKLEKVQEKFIYHWQYTLFPQYVYSQWRMLDVKEKKSGMPVWSPVECALFPKQKWEEECLLNIHQKKAFSCYW